MTYLDIKVKQAAFLLAMSTLFFCSGALAQTAAAPAAQAPKPQIAITGAATLIDKFFRAYKDDTGKAVTELFQTNKMIDSAKLTDLIGKINKERDLIGKYQGKELITQKKASASLVLYSYLVKHENQPVRFTFMFYKPKNDWMIYRFYFDETVETELQDSAKL